MECCLQDWLELDGDGGEVVGIWPDFVVVLPADLHPRRAGCIQSIVP